MFICKFDTFAIAKLTRVKSVRKVQNWPHVYETATKEAFSQLDRASRPTRGPHVPVTRRGIRFCVLWTLLLTIPTCQLLTSHQAMDRLGLGVEITDCLCTMTTVHMGVTTEVHNSTVMIVPVLSIKPNLAVTPAVIRLVAVTIITIMATITRIMLDIHLSLNMTRTDRNSHSRYSF